MKSRLTLFLLVAAYWAAIYLPGLASFEIKGEEIRRIMPGVAMLQSGHWIVPTFNGVPYLRKPPLVNWAIALSIRACRIRNEWSVRLPSVLAILLLSLGLFAAAIPWLGAEAAFSAALILLTTGGIVEKGRLAEIEALYIAATGLAFAVWLAFTATRRSPWLTWPLTGLFLGIGLLTKGPPNLAYFYAVAACIAFAAWRHRRAHAGSAAAAEPLLEPAFFSLPHLAGILIMLGLFSLWCIPYLRQTATLGAAGVWARQMQQRIGGGDSSTVFSNLLHSLLNLLPWALGIPLFWRRSALALLHPRDLLIVRAARWPIFACAFALMLIPGMLPRYTLPLAVPYALLLALLLKARCPRLIPRLPILAASIAACGMLSYGLFFASRVAAAGPARRFAAAINALLPAGSPVYIFDPSVQPEVFYIHGALLFTDTVKELPADVPWLLAPDSALPLLRLRFREVILLARLREPGGRQFTFLSLRHSLLRAAPRQAPPTPPPPPSPGPPAPASPSGSTSAPSPPAPAG